MFIFELLISLGFAFITIHYTQGVYIPAGKRAVGKRLYVFTTNAGFKVANGCVIETHGEQLFMGNTLNRTFPVGLARTIHFYTPHGAPQIYQNGTVTFAGNPARNYNYTSALDHIANGTAVEVQSTPLVIVVQITT